MQQKINENKSNRMDLARSSCRLERTDRITSEDVKREWKLKDIIVYIKEK